MALTIAKIQAAKPADKPYKLFDGRGLYLLVTPTGGRWWRFKYRWQGKERLLSLGTYPEISLGEARDKCEDHRKLVRHHTDPSEARRGEEKPAAARETFQAIGEEWLTTNWDGWVPSHAERQKQRLAVHVFPWLGERPVKEVTAPELLAVLRRVESRGTIETAHRLLSICSQVFRYAIATGRAERDPAADLRGALKPSPKNHLAAITKPRRVGELLRAIWEYPGSLVVRCALQIAGYVFVRPGELRQAEWSEFDLEAAEWRIPGPRMKRRIEHIVPLSHQVLSILAELHPLTGRGRYVFPSLRSQLRPMSDNTLVAALRTLGYAKGEMTAHGFRSIASTFLNEMGWNPDAIERQLAHQPADKVRAAYHRSEHLEERRRMMQSWADYLDGLRHGAEVVPLRRAGSGASRER